MALLYRDNGRASVEFFPSVFQCGVGIAAGAAAAVAWQGDDL